LLQRVTNEITMDDPQTPNDISPAQSGDDDDKESDADYQGGDTENSDNCTGSDMDDEADDENDTSAQIAAFAEKLRAQKQKQTKEKPAAKKSKI
jgi:hypothetical protein